MAVVKYIILGLLLNSQYALGQAKPPVLPYTLPIVKKVKDFSVDNMGNYYLLTTNNQLLKYNANGDSVGVFNDTRKYGSLHSFDVTNPLKVLLYYKDFSSILILDRFLNVRSILDLRKMDMLQVKAYALSYDNNVWVYDELTGKIKKIDEGGKLLLESSDLRVALGEAPSPETLIDNDGKLYMYDEGSGFYIFDYYGALQNKIPLTYWKHVAVEHSNIYGISGDALNIYEIKTRIQNILSIVNAEELSKVVLRNNRLYTLYKNRLVISAAKPL